MIIKTRGGNLPFKLFSFPDGQRHFKLEAWDHEWKSATIESRIANAEELFDVLLAKDVLSFQGYIVSLDVRYLLGARMDRRISNAEPHTLQLVSEMINAAGFKKIRILDPHSEVALVYLDAEPVFPVHEVKLVMAHYDSHDTAIVAPDDGASPRVRKLLELTHNGHFSVVQGVKHRDPNTGRLSAFSTKDPSLVKDKRCLILDDICDGGGTFTGLSEVLRDAGAKSVDLFVTHGIFSKGTTLEGIDQIYTTDSYHPIGKLVGPITMHVKMHEDI